MKAFDGKQVAETIDAAEEIQDPLDALVERIATDSGAPFRADALEQLSRLKSVDRAAYEGLRAQLKKGGCRVTELDKAIAEEAGDGGRGQTQADLLVAFTKPVDLFHSSDRTAFADLDINNHRETWPLRTKEFRLWLAHRFYEEAGRVPNSEALQSALTVIEARAQIEAPERPVFLRVGGDGSTLYLDLANDHWQAVEIDNASWRIVKKPPVRFRRTKGMQPLPTPVRGGSIEPLRTFLNVESDMDFVLVIAWALAVLRHRGPYPVLVLSGEQGTAKSSFSALLRTLLDPHTAPLRTLPRQNRDLFITASNGHLLAFDNISSLPTGVSDTLCRLATGGGFAVRQLYTDQDEVLFDATRPVLLNGIEDVVSRPDLADRSIFLTLEPIPEDRRLPEATLWADFEEERPRLLGALLDAVVQGLKMWPETRLERPPRMADFARWATACETAFWPTGTFQSAYSSNRDKMVDDTIEADLVAVAVQAAMSEQTEWKGTATELLGKLSEKVGETACRAKMWPQTARALSGQLRRIAPFLRQVGIDTSFCREGRARTRTLRIVCLPENGGKSASVPSAGQEKTRLRRSLERVAPRTQLPSADTNSPSGDRTTVREETPSLQSDNKEADGADAN